MKKLLTLILLGLVSGCVTSNAVRDEFDSLDITGSIDVQTVTGIDIGSGSDVDVDLLTVDLVADQRLFWDESEDLFSFTKGIAGAGKIKSSTGFTGNGSTFYGMAGAADTVFASSLGGSSISIFGDALGAGNNTRINVNDLTQDIALFGSTLSASGVNATFGTGVTANGFTALVDAGGILLGSGDDDKTGFIANTTGQPELGFDWSQFAWLLEGGMTVGENADADFNLIQVDDLTNDPSIVWDVSEKAFRTSGAQGLLISSDVNGSMTQTVDGATVESNIEIHNTGGNPDEGGLSIHTHTNNDDKSGHIYFFRSDGSHAAPNISDDNDVIGDIHFAGYDGSAYQTGAFIRSRIDGTPALGVMPGDIAFFTTDSAGTQTERAAINAAGELSVSNNGSFVVYSDLDDPAGNFEKVTLSMNTAGEALLSLTAGGTGVAGDFHVDSNFYTTAQPIGVEATLDGIDLGVIDSAGNFRHRNAGGTEVFRVESAANTVSLYDMDFKTRDTGITGTINGGITRNGYNHTSNSGSTLGVAATTFAVDSNFAIITGDGGGNTIATITGLTEPGILVLEFTDALVTITDDNTDTANSVDLSAAFTGADDTTLTLQFNGTSFKELSRSVN